MSSFVSQKSGAEQMDQLPARARPGGPIGPRDETNLDSRTERRADPCQGTQLEPVPTALVAMGRRGAGPRTDGEVGERQTPCLPEKTDLGGDGKPLHIITHDKISSA